MSFVYKGDVERGHRWAALFAQKAPEIGFRMWPDIGDAREVRYLAAWIPPDDILGQFPNLEVLFSVGAGIDQFDLSAIPPHIPVVRMIEPGLEMGMVQYVCQAVLSLHRDMHTYRLQQNEKRWQPLTVTPAPQRRIGVMGMGVLGRASLEWLAKLGFACAGWSRSAHRIDGVTTYHGNDQLDAFLAATDILVCLLPLTDSTRHILDAKLIGKLAPGSMLINVGRGQHLVEADLLDALDRGHLAHAIIDVAQQEPLPDEHRFWTHPGVTLTPHIASQTQPDSAVEVVIDNVRRHRAGEAMAGVVDRVAGY
jgi:glyoxylate/hydroxypyruvate reductase